MIWRAAITGLLLCLPATVPAWAVPLSLEFPAPATTIARAGKAQASYFLPLAPYSEGKLNGLVAEGTVRQETFRVGAGGLTTLQLMAPLRKQLAGVGYYPVFECETNVCGGFDFRFHLDIMPEPDMHVNLGDFRYLAARRMGAGGPEYVSVLVSRSANAGFVHLTQIGASEPAAEINASTKAPDAPIVLDSPGPIGEQLGLTGHATLDDLTFQTGSARLGDQQFASLADLAAFLVGHPESRVMLVGHTDATGALDGNIALSRKRALAVADRLVQNLGVPRSQVSADGVGFLSPRASNQTDEGRARNRRVEAVLTTDP